jgi:hypothetical protein
VPHTAVATLNCKATTATSSTTAEAEEVWQMCTAAKKEVAMAVGSAGAVMITSLLALPSKQKWWHPQQDDPQVGLEEMRDGRRHAIPQLDGSGDISVCLNLVSHLLSPPPLPTPPSPPNDSTTGRRLDMPTGRQTYRAI